MSMKRYKVIWFDDEFKSLKSIKERATLSGVDLIGFENAKDGISELESNISNYDAAIVDGKFFKNSSQSGDAIDDTALFDVARALDRLSDRKKLPWFILSGQLSFTKEKNRYADGYKNNKVYDKLKEKDVESLWTDLANEADQQEETRIRHHYASIFEICNDEIISVDAQKPLLQILKSLNHPTAEFDHELYFTQIRIILESIFRAANKIGLLHDKCIPKGQVNLTESSLFMAGEQTKHLGVFCNKIHFNKIIAESVKSILFITGAASHSSDPEIKNNINFQDYRKAINTPFLLYSLTFQVMDVLIWYKFYSIDNYDKKINKSFWAITSNQSQEWVMGEVINVNGKGFAFFKPQYGLTNTFIPPAIFNEYSLTENLKVEAVIEEYPDTKSGEIKTRVKELRYAEAK
jgi:hypothetical protein